MSIFVTIVGSVVDAFRCSSLSATFSVPSEVASLIPTGMTSLVLSMDSLAVPLIVFLLDPTQFSSIEPTLVPSNAVSVFRMVTIVRDCSILFRQVKKSSEEPV